MSRREYLREYLAVCANGHRSYLRLDLIPADDTPPATGRCTTCGQPAGLEPLGPPGTVTPNWLRVAETVAKAQVEPSPPPPKVKRGDARAEIERLQAAQAENQQLRDLLQRARMFLPWPAPLGDNGPKLTRLHTEIAAALEQQAAQAEVDNLP